MAFKRNHVDRAGDASHIMDVMLSLILDVCCLSDDGWVQFERRNVDRAEMLHLSTVLACTSSPMREFLSFTIS